MDCGERRNSILPNCEDEEKTSNLSHTNITFRFIFMINHCDYSSSRYTTDHASD